MAKARKRRRRSNAETESSGPSAFLGHESEYWRMADALRGSMDAAEYKHVVLGLIFLKYISDAFEEAHAKLEAEVDQGADPEHPDEYRAQSIFWVPPEARWTKLQSQARQPAIGRTVDDAMTAIERDNPALKDVLPKDYARPALDKARLGQVVDLVSNIKVGGAEARATDVLGSVYEYFLEQFALAEGRKGGEFYTPRSVVRLLVEMLEPYQGRVYDPCCGSSGMFVQSMAFIDAHTSGNGNLPAPKLRQAGGGNAREKISIYGQESNYTTWRMARMNLAIRGIEGQIEHGDSFQNDRHPDLRADYILANPPFNVSDWGGDRLRDDKRWEYGVPPVGNANFAWVQHFLHHLAPRGTAGFVLANGSMSSSQSGEGEIRKNLIEADLVDCMVALPGQLFRSTQIPACLWFIARDRPGQPSPGASRHPLPRGEGHYRGGLEFSGLLERAREMRRQATPAEAFAWALFRDRRFLGLKFRCQHQVGSYIVDLYCHEKRLVVELDGPVHDDPKRQPVDANRDADLESLGMTVVRIPNDHLVRHTEEALNEIADALDPSPAGRGAGGEGELRDRRREILFIDARKMGHMVDRTHRDLSPEDIARIADTYHAWRSDSSLPVREGWGEDVAVYRDISGFCKSASLEEIRKHGHVLTPGRYVGAEPQEDDLPAPKPGTYFVYVISCEGGSHYIGHTDNIPRRWKEHVSGKAAEWTRKNRPRYIPHYEEFGSREEAAARERELKTSTGRRWLKRTIAEGRARQAGGEPFEAKMARLTAQWREQQAEAKRLDAAIEANLKRLGFGDD